MDPMSEEQLDYGDDEYGGSQKSQVHVGAIPALAEEELMGEDDDYEDLYNDVNIGEGFMQTLQQRSEPPTLAGSSGLPSQRSDGPGTGVIDPGFSRRVSIPGVGVEGNGLRVNTNYPTTEQPKVRSLATSSLAEGTGSYANDVSQKGNEKGNMRLEMAADSNVGNMRFQFGPSSSSSMPLKIDANPAFPSGPPFPPDPGSGGIRSGPPMLANQAGQGGNHPAANDVSRPMMGNIDSNGPTMLFVGELHWWTTDADLESALSRYGRVKEIKFFDERASGKSKGYCQVEFYEPAAAAACKEGMNGHVFNGRPCVVAFASEQTLKQMGAGYMKRNQIQVQSQSQSQGRGNMNDINGRVGANYGKAGWGRGGQGMMNRGQGNPGPMRGRGATGARSMVGGAGVGPGLTGGPYGPGFVGPGFGNAAGAMMNTQAMMGTGFDPMYMGRGCAYGGFTAPAFPGMMPSFPNVNAVGLAGVAPHINPAFFGRGMVPNGMGMMGGGMDVNSAGAWSDIGMGWNGEEHGKTRESSHGGDNVASDYGYGEATLERGGRSNTAREERDSERDRSGNSERRQHDEREKDWERSNRDRYREEKDQRHKNRDPENGDDWDRGQNSSKSRSKPRMMQEDHRPHSRDGDFGKRRRE